MAVKVTISGLVPSSVPSGGWIVGYKVKGTPGAYTMLPPFFADPIEFTTLDSPGTLYDLSIKRDCGDLNSAEYFTTTPCQCSETYVPVPAENQCFKVEVVSPTVTNSGFCLAASTNGAYTSEGSRIYSPGFNDSTLSLPPGSSGGLIIANLTATPQWNNPSLSSSVGPMNREGVWIDSDCDGNKNPLSGGTQTTLAFTYNNVGIARTVYIGIGADNNWKLVVNGTVIGEMTLGGAGATPFKIWHIIPVTFITGLNYVNVVAIGDGSASDAVGIAVYDNNASQIAAATNDSQLNILFRSSSLRGQSYDVTTCPSGYSLDVSGGSGNYQCVRNLYKVCNTFDT